MDDVTYQEHRQHKKANYWSFERTHYNGKSYFALLTIFFS
jgi:hypothetical protein